MMQAKAPAKPQEVSFFSELKKTLSSFQKKKFDSADHFSSIEKMKIEQKAKGFEQETEQLETLDEAKDEAMEHE